MAGADYYSCDVCGSKTFYDANLNYDFDKRDAHGNPKLDYVGAMACICDDCAKTHKIGVVAIAAPTDAKADEEDRIRATLDELGYDDHDAVAALFDLASKATTTQSVRDALEQAAKIADAEYEAARKRFNIGQEWSAGTIAQSIRALIQSPQPGEA